jgi:hypothetical protein
MKAMFKPLGLVAAVAAVTAGYSGVTNAQTRSIGNLGDLAIVPYYSTSGDWVTGVHIINSSARTQVVKLRLRRGSDSQDVMDFNLIMSPFDEWTGNLDDTGPNGTVVFSTDDNTCTAPIIPNGRFEMPIPFAGAGEGYIEVIGMGAAYDEDMPMAVAAKHDDDGVPFDCISVETNFFANSDGTTPGVAFSDTTFQEVDDADDYDGDEWCDDDEGSSLCVNFFDDATSALKVSYFFRNTAAGTEMGGNAVHIEDFAAEAWMSNQEFGLASGDVTGFDYPDLNGGVLGYGNTRGMFNILRQSDLLGVDNILNDWSVNSALNVQTDWVVTMPGQYTMLDFVVYISNGLDVANCGVLNNPNTAVDDGIAQCDFRDIPVVAVLDTWNREEFKGPKGSGSIVISPQIPGQANKLLFPNEVNVVEWTDGSTEPVFSSEYTVHTVDPTATLGVFGWTNLSVTAEKKTATTGVPPVPSPDANSNGQAVCEFRPTITEITPSPIGVDAVPSNTMRQGICIPATAGSGYGVPIVGFVAWQRSFPGNPDANYGRLIDHSFSSN